MRACCSRTAGRAIAMRAMVAHAAGWSVVKPSAFCRAGLTRETLQGSSAQSLSCPQPDISLQLQADGQQGSSAHSHACVMTPPTHKAGTTCSEPIAAMIVTIRLIRCGSLRLWR